MKTTAQLNQSTAMKGKRLFALEDNGVLRVSHAEAGRVQEFSFDVSQLNPEPTADAFKATSMIAGMAVFGLAAGFFVFAALGPGHSRGAELPVLAVAAVFVLPVLLCWREYLKRSYDVLIFQNPYTGAQVSFLRDIPTPDEFGKFMDLLKSEITGRRNNLQQFSKSLSQELRELAKLHEDGVLSDEEFTIAKRMLIDREKGAGAIGFGPK